MNSVNECFESVKKDCLKYISSQETKTEKFKKKDQMIKSFLIPISFWIAKKTSKKLPIVIGLAGGQGTGKTPSRWRHAFSTTSPFPVLGR